MTHRLATSAALAAGLVLAPAAAAQATEHHKPAHDTKAEKRHDRRVEARKDRRAERAATKPAQDTPNVSGRATGAQPSRATRGQAKPAGMSCVVTADRGPLSFLVVNGCQTAQTLTVSVQDQPGPWVKGMCQAHGGCSLVTRYTVTVATGAHTIGLASRCGWTQYDLKDAHGRLVKSLHVFRDCTPDKPRPPVAHPKPVPPVVQPHQPSWHVEGHSAPVPTSTEQLAYTGAGETEYALLVAAGLLVLGGISYAGGRNSDRQARAMRAGIESTKTSRRARRDR